MLSLSLVLSAQWIPSTLHYKDNMEKSSPELHNSIIFCYKVDQDAAQHVGVHVLLDHHAGGLRQVLGHLQTNLLPGT